MRKPLSSPHLMWAWLLLLPLFALPVSANGLFVNSTSISVNKTLGQNVSFSFLVQNQEPWEMVNISFEAQGHVVFPAIPSLLPGATFNASGLVVGNSNANVSLRLRGFYLSNVGASNTTHNVVVTSFQSAPCSFTITKGDSVLWKSSVQSVINLRDFASNAPIDGAQGLHFNDTYLRTFLAPGSFATRWNVGSWGFPEACTITILDDNGFVNNPTFDGFLNLNIKVLFDPTNITLIHPIANYSIDFFNEPEGVLSITNIGPKPAKEIRLSAQDIQFSANTFDLEPGQSRNILYTVKRFVFTTDQTNKSHVRTIRVEGNFPTQETAVQVFVKHAIIGSAEGLNGSQSLIDLICSQRPDLCDPTKNVVYRYVDNGTLGFNVTITEEQWRDYNLRQIEEQELRLLREKKQTTLEDDLKTWRNDSDHRFGNVEKNLDRLLVQQDQNSTNFWVLLCIGVLGVSSIITFFLVMHYRQINKMEALKRW